MKSRYLWIIITFCSLYSFQAFGDEAFDDDFDASGLSFTCDCPCEHPCDCGCEEGWPCFCGQQQPAPYVPSCENECNFTTDFNKPCYCGKNDTYIRNRVRRRNCTYGRCSHQYPKRCCHKACHWRYWCAAHSVWKGPYDCLDGDCATAYSCGRYGVWLPEDGLLFKPYVADPRQVTYSVGWRFYDSVTNKNVIPVSFGDNLAIYRWCSVWPFGGQLQINIEGAVWAVFAPLEWSSPLINADYYVGFPVTYAIGRWALRVRAYHISSHIGDEYLIMHPKFIRRNPSAEYLDAALSYYITDEIRLYGGAGWIIQHDESFDAGNYYIEGGAELRMLELGFYDECQNLFGHPFMGMYFLFNNRYDAHIDNTYVIGYEWGKTCGNRKCVRAFLEYHNGYSVEGQFRKFPTDYLSIRLSYGY